MAYRKIRAGEWVQPVMSPRSYGMMCCDCGLTHSMHFRVVFDSKGKPRVQFKAYRRNKRKPLQA